MAKVTIYNPTKVTVWAHVNGQLIAVPAEGSEQVAEPLVKALLTELPQLRCTIETGHTPEDFELVRTKLKKAELVALCTMLMKGLSVRVADVLPDTEAPDDGTAADTAQEEAGAAPPTAE